MGPLVLGAVFSHISGIVDNILASKLPSGHLSYLGYSKKLIDAILLIGPVALVTVFFSHASHLVSLNDHEILRKMLRKITRLLLYVSVPFACLLIALNEPIISFLFQRGEFSIESTLGTSQAFMIYAVGLVTFSFEPLLVHSFFALSDTKTPVKFGVICVIFDIILAIALLKPFGYMGIAGAFVLSKTIKILILGTILNKRLPGIFDYKQISFLFRLSVATLLMWIVLKFTTDIDNNNTPLNTLIFDLAIPSISAILTFVLASVLLRIQEFRELLLIFKGRKK
jgi:putative peptidoglycan lipid II flippase